MRAMFARRWRERDLRGMWFWGSWLLIRWNVFPMITALLSGTLGWFLVGVFRGLA